MVRLIFLDSKVPIELGKVDIFSFESALELGKADILSSKSAFELSKADNLSSKSAIVHLGNGEHSEALGGPG